MEKSKGRVVQVVGEETFVLNLCLVEMTKKEEFQDYKIALIAVTGKSTWKYFLLNSTMHHLWKEGGGDWFEQAWNSRTENLFHGNDSKDPPNGIYVWSEPFLTKTSRGDKTAVFLMDVVIDGPEHPLNALASLICSTLICVSELNIEVSHPNFNTIMHNI